MTEKTLCLLTLCAALLVPATSNAEGGPGAIDAFRKADSGISALLKDAKASDKLRRRADALLDYRSLAIDALGGSKQFEARCGARCPEFVGRLTKIVRRDHLQSVKARRGGNVEYLGEKVGKSVTVVKTRVTLPASKARRVGKASRTQKIDYVMHKVHGAWQVRDIVTDGVILSATYRAEFAKLADAEGIGAVLSELDTRLELSGVRVH